METFSALLIFCAGNSPVTNEFPSQRPVMQSFDVFFDLCLSNEWLGKQGEAGDLRRHHAHYEVTNETGIHPLPETDKAQSQTGFIQHNKIQHISGLHNLYR